MTMIFAVWRIMPRRALKRMLLNIDEREFLAIAEAAAFDDELSDADVAFFRDCARERVLGELTDASTAH